PGCASGALHATRAEHEQRLLERVRLRLVLSKEGDQKRTEEEETFLEPFPSSEGNLPLLPAFRRRKHLSVFLQSIAAVLLVGLLVGSFLTALRLSRPGTTTVSNLARNWHVMSGPHLPSSQNHLWGVSASAENDATVILLPIHPVSRLASKDLCV
ncbi:MAG TPA: hypothetical protein VFN35_17370, partial [Ktedonobacteraceae bacterium]|nr:hypothetical protein [Ktedonobacteraceae bacterium]